MNQSSLSKWLKLIIITVGLCGLLVYAWVIPSFGQTLAVDNPEFAHCYWPWLLLIWATAVPCYIALVFAWRIAANIGNNRSFSADNAKLLKQIAVLAAADVGFFFAMNIVYLLLNMNHPGFVLMSLVILVVGVFLSATFAGLSHLVMKAADLQAQSDLTI